jgi:hypothetical protein
MITYGQILAVYFAANDSELRDGARFYGDAFSYCEELASSYGIDADTAAAVVAALSPNNNWERNKLDALNLIRAYTLGGHNDALAIKTSTYNANKLKALRILSGEQPLTVLGGLKVRAFYGCIIGDPDAICVDGHAYSIWTGLRVPTSKTPKISPKLYAAISADYIKATAEANRIMGANISPAQLQAITWLAWRRLVKRA